MRFHSVHPSTKSIISLPSLKLNEQRGIFKSENKLLKCFITQPEFTCSKLTLVTLEQGEKYVQS